MVIDQCCLHSALRADRKAVTSPSSRSGSTMHKTYLTRHIMTSCNYSITVSD